MKRYSRLIFVDNGDTGRAPMAKLIMGRKHLLSELEILSRGLVVLFQEPINQKAEAVLISNGLDPREHRSLPLLAEDMGPDVLVLTVDDFCREKLCREFSEAQNVYTLKGYIGEEGDIQLIHGEPLLEYGHCYEVLDADLDKLVVLLNEEELRQ